MGGWGAFFEDMFLEFIEDVEFLKVEFRFRFRFLDVVL